MPTLGDYSNVYNTALLILQQKGFYLWYDKASDLFAEITETSTLSETQYNYACFLADEKRTSEAREWAERVLAKKPTMPAYLRRRERPWFRKASALLKRLPR